MPTSFYDVVVLGTHLEPLLCAALLAREGLRVLVLGQGVPDPSYSVAGVAVEPYGITLVGAQSPIVQETLEALALRQEVRQHTPDPPTGLQLILPDGRLDVHPSADPWLDEVARELPDVRRQAADITRTLEEVRIELDALVARELVWPPESFLERQRFALASSGQRYDRRGQGWTSWNQLASRHPLRAAFASTLTHLSSLTPTQHSDATRARLHGHLLEGVGEPIGGWTWFRDALFERIRSWGGDVRPSDAAESIGPHRGGHAVSLSRTGEEIGCSRIVHGTPVAELSRLLPERTSLSPLFERVGEPRVRAYRCSVHVLAASSVLPAALAPIALVSPDAQTPELAFWLRTQLLADARVLFTLSTTVDEHLVDTASSPLRFVRDDALSALRMVVPFIGEHAVWIDSPHDGLPPRSFRSPDEPSCSEPWWRGPSTMRAIHEYPTRRALGVCALPTRTPVRGVYLCNDQVAPGLGLEGAFLAATSAARVVTARYRRREWLRRGPWARRSV